MLVGSRLLSDGVKLLILHVARDLTRLQTARLRILAKMKPGLAAPEVSLVEHHLAQLSHVEDTAADGLSGK